MVRRSHESPAWRVFGAALGAFAIGIQLLLSAWLIGQAAAAADQIDLAVICSHDPAATADDSGAPPVPHPHGQCPACACPQSAQLFVPPPVPPRYVVLRPRSAALPARSDVAVTTLRLVSPYLSRAPPFSA